VDPWSADWQPAIGDDVEVELAGSGTITRIRGDQFEIDYDPVVFDIQADGSRTPVPSEPEKGWHRREELRPGQRTLARLIQARAAM
jgi:hypothetical protein